MADATHGSHAHVAQDDRVQRQLDAAQHFPDQNPNPVLRIGADGELQYANPASEVIVRDLTPGVDRTFHLRGHKGWVWSIAFSAHGKRLVTGGDDGTVLVIDTGSNTVTATVRVGTAPWTRPAVLTMFSPSVLSSAPKMD